MRYGTTLSKAVATMVFGALLVVLPTGGASADPIPADGPRLAAIYPCSVDWIDNPQMGSGLYARPDPPGPYTWTWTEETHYGHSGPRVIEVQCLLKYLASTEGSIYDPGTVDGRFGPKTRNAVVNAQIRCYWEKDYWDGAVGPITWLCLRQQWSKWG